MLGKNLSEWRKLVLERDNYTCQRCRTKDNIISHHIKSTSCYPELSLDTDNGKTYCRKCHHFIHWNICGIQLQMFSYEYCSWVEPYDHWYPKLRIPRYDTVVKNSIKRAKIQELEEAGLVPIGLLT